jgi:hypothetical protein
MVAVTKRGRAKKNPQGRKALQFFFAAMQTLKRAVTAG